MEKNGFGKPFISRDFYELTLVHLNHVICVLICWIIDVGATTSLPSDDKGDLSTGPSSSREVGEITFEQCDFTTIVGSLKGSVIDLQPLDGAIVNAKVCQMNCGPESKLCQYLNITKAQSCMLWVQYGSLSVFDF